MSSQKLWVLHQTAARNYGPTRVSTDGCYYVDDFRKEIKKESQLAIPQNSPITLYQPDGNTEINPTDNLQLLKNAGKIGNAPLIVMTAAIGKSRLASTRKMAVEASCRKYLDAIARQISEFYEFEYNHRCGATMGNVLAAKDGNEGTDWVFRLALKNSTQIDDEGFQKVVKKGQKLTLCPLPELFQPDEWEKISKFNSLTSERIHSAELPRLSDGRAYIIIPFSMYSVESVAFLKDIGVRSFLLSDPGALVVKNEDTWSESSFMG